MGSINKVAIKKEGYETFYTTFSRDEELDVGAVIGGILFTFPFLWVMKYKESHIYELEPILE